MVRVANSLLILVAQSHGSVSFSEDEVVLLQAHQTVKSRPVLTNSPRENSGRENHAQALEQTYENMVRDVIRDGPSALPTDAVLDPAINQFDVLKVELKIDRGMQQDAVNEANAALAACHSKKDTGFSTPDVGINALKTATDVARAAHQACRVQENSLASDRDTKCAAFTAVSSGQQCNSEDWLTQNGDGLVAAAKACSGAKDGIVDTENQCDHDQKEFEEEFCAFASKLTSTCENYDACRSEEGERRNGVYDAAKELEESHKRIWVAYGKAVCFLNLLKDARGGELTEDKLKGCIETMPDTSELDLVYPGAPAVQDCSTASVSSKPGDDAWRAAEYGASPFSDHPDHLQATDVCPQGSVQVPENFLHKCPHEDGWDYILDYGDDRTKDDIPDDGATIAAGFSNENAYYIGNEELAKLDLAEVQLCALVSGSNCNSNCFSLSDGDTGNPNSWNNVNKIPDNCFPELTPLMRSIAVFTGQCTDTHFVWMDMPNDKFSTFEGDFSDQGWMCGGYHRFYTWTGANAGWHAEGWGLTLSIKHSPRHGAGYEFGWYDTTCGMQAAGNDADVLQIRVKVK